MRLIQAREAAGLTQGQAAKLLHISRVMVTKAEAGEQPVPELLIRACATVYDVSEAWLAAGVESPAAIPGTELAKLAPADREQLRSMLARMPAGGGR